MNALFIPFKPAYPSKTLFGMNGVLSKFVRKPRPPGIVRGEGHAKAHATVELQGKYQEGVDTEKLGYVKKMQGRLHCKCAEA